MISIQYELACGRAIRHRTWPPFQYAKLVSGSDGERRLYRCYPDGHVEILDVRVSELSCQDGWSIVGPPSDGPLSVA